jgi:hypothetical protein
MQVRVIRPGRAARSSGTSDLRTTVVFHDPETLPLPLRIHFVPVGHKTGERELRNVGVDLGEVPRDEASAVALPALTALALRHVVERYPHYVELARAHVMVDLDQDTKGLTSATKRVKPGRIDRDWLRMIAAEYQRHIADGEPAPITAIAKSHGVTPSAASRWVKAARGKHLLEEADDAS